MKVSRRAATSSTSIVISVGAPATVHISMTWVTHALSHIEPMGSAAAGAAVIAADVEASAMPVIGVVDAATANTRHARLNARATAAQRPRRDKRATWTAMGVHTRER